MKITCIVVAISLLIVGTKAFISNSSWTPDLVFAFFQAKDIHQLDGFLCDKTDGVRLMKFFSYPNRISKHSIAFRILQDWSPVEFISARMGVFVDLACKENQMLTERATDLWFDVNYVWLVVDKYNYLESCPLRLSLYSDVVVTKNGELFQVTDSVENTSMELIPIGDWEGGEKKLNMTIPVITPNLHRTALTGSYFAAQDFRDKNNASKQLQDINSENDFDSGDTFFYSLILDVSDMYNFSIHLVEAQRSSERSNGTGNGTVGQHQTENADVEFTPSAPLSTRLDDSYGLPVLQKYWFALVFKQPRVLGTYRALILELSSGLWAMVILIFIVGAIVVYLTQHLGGDRSTSFDLSIVQSVGVLANQGLTVMPERTSARIACFSLLFVSLLVSNYYNASTMTALLSESHPSIRTFDDFLKSDIPMNLINATYMTSISDRKEVFYPKAWHRVLGDVGIVSLQNGLEGVRKGQAGFCAKYQTLFQGIDSHFNDEEKCSLTVFPVNTVYTAMRFIKKDKHLLEMLSRGLIKALECGIAAKKREDLIKGPPSCFRNVPFIPVQLESVTVAFGIFLTGVFMSAIVFIWEKLCFMKKRPNASHFELVILEE